ncbi:MAG: neutral/alkaline non-lysosomal ceramidase N-terminal domain-containing protein [Rhizobiaceae bacterium]|nr:neutral/alkaline non-lysosomal ceramidase N-terminal domain-containing protein [Rhizobiaceae bacterium]
MMKETTLFKCGVGRADMTPPVGIPHILWGARTIDLSQSIHLPLRATALCLENDGDRVLVCDLDVTGLPTDVCDEMRASIERETQIPAAKISIGATHTHSAPVWNAETTNGSSPDMPGMELMPAWREKCRQAVLDAARMAVHDLRPARVASGYGKSEVTVNRRFVTPEGRIVVSPHSGSIRDTTLSLLRFDDLDGNTIASVVGYGTHPIVLAHQNTAISSEFPGALKEGVEKLIGGTCLFLQGCAGDQIPYEALSGDVRLAERIGNRIAADAATTLAVMSPMNYRMEFSEVVESGAPLGLHKRTVLADNPTTLGVASAVVELPVKAFEPMEILEERAASTKKELHALKAKGADHATLADIHFRARRADIILGMAKRVQGVSTVPIEIRALRVGDAVLVTAPMEIFSATGLAIREASPFPMTFVGGYSNGTEGYLPPADVHAEGGYEVDIACYVSEGAEAVFRKAAIDLVRSLHAA